MLMLRYASRSRLSCRARSPVDRNVPVSSGFFIWLLLTDAGDTLAKMFPLKQADECLGGIFEAINNFFTIFDLAAFNPAAHLLGEIRIKMVKSVKDDKALHLELLAQDLAHQPVHPVRPVRQVRRVVLRHQSA